MMNFNAAVVREKGGAFAIECVAIDEPRDSEVLVARAIRCAALIPVRV